MRTNTLILMVAAVLMLNSCGDIASIGSAVDCSANPSDSSCQFTVPDTGGTTVPNGTQTPNNKKNSTADDADDADDDSADVDD